MVAAAQIEPMLVTPQDAAKALAICERHLFRLTKDGELNCVRIGRAVRYEPAELSAWISRRRNRNTCSTRKYRLYFVLMAKSFSDQLRTALRNHPGSQYRLPRKPASLKVTCRGSHAAKRVCPWPRWTGFSSI